MFIIIIISDSGNTTSATGATSSDTSISSNNNNNVNNKDDDADEDEDANIQSINPETSRRKAISPKWPTRVFAMECLQKIMATCEDNEAHFNLAEAKTLVMKGQGAPRVLKVVFENSSE